jgi:hypothetical protein
MLIHDARISVNDSRNATSDLTLFKSDWLHAGKEKKRCRLLNNKSEKTRDEKTSVGHHLHERQG